MTDPINQACARYIDRLLAEKEKVDAERMLRIEREFQRLEQLMAAEMRAQALAVNKSESAYNARFMAANEFRDSLDDMTRTMVSRDFIDTLTKGIDQRLTATETRLANYDGRILGYSAGIGMVVLIISIVAQLIGLGG